MSFTDYDYALFFAVIIVVLFIGFISFLWRKPKTMDDITEWGLGGRRFGTVVIWFLLGGDMYTAYTLIAVPGVAGGSGALAMFAITYGIMIYPIVYLMMPRLWTVSKNRNYITVGDFVKDRFSSPFLALLIAMTGVLAELPYLALQMVSIGYVMQAILLPVSISLIIAFLLVAAFTFLSGMRAPALTAILKDAIIWGVVLTIVIYVPIHYGGFGNIFATASSYTKTTKTFSPLDMPPSLALGYVTLALGSALALFLYPHGITGTLGSKDVRTIKRNASLLPLYNVLLLIVAILGIAAVVANGAVFGTKGQPATSFAFPYLIKDLFPSTFTALAYAAIVVGSVVPASIMALASANLLTRNVYVEYINKNATSAQQARLSKFLVIVVIVAALIFSLTPAASGYVIYLQTFGGAFILQTLPAVYLALYTRKFSKYSIGAGWFIGLSSTLYILYLLNFSGSLYAPIDYMYVGIFGLILNVAAVLIMHGISLLLHKVKDEGIIENSEMESEF